MTTTVTITSRNPNHHKVGVQVDYKGVGENPPLHVLDDGESATVYVHDNAQVLLTEVKKEPAA